MPRQHRHAYAAGFPRGLLANQAVSRSESPAASLTVGARCTPAQIHQVSSRFESYRVSSTGSLALRLSVSLAGPGPSGGTGPSRLCRACSHPTPRLQGQAAPSFTELLRQPGGGALHPTRFNGAPWRTTRFSKSRVCRDRCRANGTASITTVRHGRHASRRSRQRTRTSQTPKSSARHVDGCGCQLCLAAVVHPQCGHARRRRRSRTSTYTTRSSSTNSTPVTHTPTRLSRRLNTALHGGWRRRP